jgi:UDP:flavonoid glycosyltransferase YjiC (YdhE family)
VAAVLDPLEVTPESVRAEVSRVLEDPSYRRNAERLRNEIAALPELTEAVGLIERLALDGERVPK